MEGQKFTRVPNEYLEYLIGKQIPQHSWRCLLYIIRQSWGYNRKTAELRNKDIVKNTGLVKQHVNRAIRWLSDEQFIKVTSIDYKLSKTYRINFNYELSRQPEEKYPLQVTEVTSTDYESNRYRLPNVTSTGYSNSSKPNTDAALRDPKEIKENIKKKKESAKPKEPKEGSLSSLNRKRMTEAEMQQRAQLLHQQAELIKRENLPAPEIIAKRLNDEKNPNGACYDICSVCQDYGDMQWNVEGYRICRQCFNADENWLEMARAAT